MVPFLLPPMDSPTCLGGPWTAMGHILMHGHKFVGHQAVKLAWSIRLAKSFMMMNAVDVMMPGIVRKNISVKIGKFISEGHAYVVMGRRWLQTSERNLCFLFGFNGSLMVTESSMMCMNRCFKHFVGMTIGQVISTDHYRIFSGRVWREALANPSYHIIGPFRLIANSE